MVSVDSLVQAGPVPLPLLGGLQRKGCPGLGKPGG